MKKIFNFTIVSGIIIIVAGAGGYETMSASFFKSFAIMISGALLMGVGALGRERCRRFGKKCVKNSRRRKNTIALTAENVCRKTA